VKVFCVPFSPKANLRDNMTNLELIFTMLGEKVTAEISQQEQPDLFSKNRKITQRGGKVAGNARKETEKELGRSVVSEHNFLTDSSIDQRGRLEGDGK